MKIKGTYPNVFFGEDYHLNFFNPLNNLMDAGALRSPVVVMYVIGIVMIIQENSLVCLFKVKVMKRMSVVYLLFFIVTWLACSGSRELVPTRARQVKTTQVIGYHAPVEMTIAWYPYQELEFKQKKDRNWVIFSDTTQYRGGLIPMILVTYPESRDSLWLDMHIDTRLLGNLIKHTLMTQEPIQRPFGQYLDQASCTKCHPEDVKVNFN